MPYPLLPGESERQQALDDLRLLDSPQEERFDRITRVLAASLEVPIALVSLVDRERQWFKACHGLSSRETPRSASFCAHAIADVEIFEIPDARLDARFATNPLVLSEPYIRFYAGKPIRSPTGERIGTLCAIDHNPRSLDARERGLLEDLAGWVELEIAAVRLSHATHDLNAAHTQLATILDSAGEAIITFDADGVIVHANAAATTITGWPTLTLLGQHVHSALHGHDDEVRCESETCDLLALDTSEPAAVVKDGQVWRADGSPVDVSYSVAPLASQPSSTAGVLVFGDATQARQVERLREEFVSVLGHELRTPLLAVRTSLELLFTGSVAPIPAAAGDLAEVGLRNANRLTHLLDDVLDLERFAAGHAGIERRRCDLAQIIDDGVLTVQALARVQDIRIKTQVSTQELWADPDRLVQVLTNLLSNAIKFSPEGGLIRVSGKSDGITVRIAVTDHGRGIPEQMLNTVFDRFSQVDRADNTEKGGTGLGLAIAQRIVEEHAGHMEVTSRVGAGSTFSVVLPIAGNAR